MATVIYQPTRQGATYVVAASDAPDHVKASADWVCDGTADDVQINAAIAACTNGGKVVLSEGTFYLSTTVNLVDYVSLVGQNKYATVLSLINNANCDMINGSGKDYVEISHMYLEGNNGNNTTSEGILLETCTYFHIHDLYIHTTNDEAIFIDNGSNVGMVDHCFIVSPSGRGVHVRSSDHVDVSDNYIYGCQPSGSEGDGVDIDAADWCRVANNEIVGCKRRGIYVEEGATGTTVTGNICKDGTATNTAMGIMVGCISALSTKFTTISGNVCYNNTGWGIYVQSSTDASAEVLYTTITGNICMNNGENGIDVRKATGTVSDVTITGNICVDDQGSPTQGYGIYIDNDVENVTCYNNICHGNATADILLVDAPSSGISGTFTFSETIEHSDFTDDGGFSGHYDLNSLLPDRCEFVSCDVTISEAFQDTVGNNSAVNFELGDSVPNDDRFYMTPSTGDDIWGSTTSFSWGAGECQGVIKATAATTLRITLTTDSDFTDLYSGAGSQGIMTVKVTYRKL